MLSVSRAQFFQAGAEVGADQAAFKAPDFNLLCQVHQPAVPLRRFLCRIGEAEANRFGVAKQGENLHGCERDKFIPCDGGFGTRHAREREPGCFRAVFGEGDESGAEVGASGVDNSSRHVGGRRTRRRKKGRDHAERTAPPRKTGFHIA
jgi:hypothetical protein